MKQKINKFLEMEFGIAGPDQVSIDTLIEKAYLSSVADQLLALNKTNDDDF